jgi:hypothetical protein
MRNVDTSELTFFVRNTQAEIGAMYRRDTGCLGSVGLFLRTSPGLDSFFEGSHLNWYFGYEECCKEAYRISILQPFPGSSEVSKIAKEWDYKLVDGSDMVLVGLTEVSAQVDLNSSAFRENLRGLDDGTISSAGIVLAQFCDELVTYSFFSPQYEQLVKSAMVNSGCTKFIDKEYRKCKPSFSDLFLRTAKPTRLGNNTKRY